MNLFGKDDSRWWRYRSKTLVFRTQIQESLRRLLLHLYGITTRHWQVKLHQYTNDTGKLTLVLKESNKGPDRQRCSY